MSENDPNLRDKVSRKHYLYHVTSPENTKSIMREGILKKNGFCVYLSEDPYSWWRPGMDIIRVRITGLKGLKTFLPELDEILSFEDISPLRLYSFIPPKSAYKKYRAREEHFRDVTKMNGENDVD